MHEMTQHTKELLKAICQHGPITVRELDELGVHVVDVRAAVHNLQTHGHVQGVKHGKTAVVYSVTRRGKMLAESFTLGLGEVAAPRQAVSSASFTGTKWRIRQGGDENLKHPSRRCDELVSHRGPISMSGFVDAVGIHGGRV